MSLDENKVIRLIPNKSMFLSLLLLLFFHNYAYASFQYDNNYICSPLADVSSCSGSTQSPLAKWDFGGDSGNIGETITFNISCMGDRSKVKSVNPKYTPYFSSGSSYTPGGCSEVTYSHNIASFSCTTQNKGAGAYMYITQVLCEDTANSLAFINNTTDDFTVTIGSNNSFIIPASQYTDIDIFSGEQYSIVDKNSGIRICTFSMDGTQVINFTNNNHIAYACMVNGDPSNQEISVSGKRQPVILENKAGYSSIYVQGQNGEKVQNSSTSGTSAPFYLPKVNYNYYVMSVNLGSFYICQFHMDSQGIVHITDNPWNGGPGCEQSMTNKSDSKITVCLQGPTC
ncbi:MAG: hypothetical protein AAGA27_07750 [Pseudomonadota bacterium]